MHPKFQTYEPRGVIPNKEVGGGLGPHIKFECKIWGKVRPSSPNKRKHLGSSVTTRLKSWGKVPILGSYLKFRGQNLGYLSLIFLEAKFRAPTRISEANFGKEKRMLKMMENKSDDKGELIDRTAWFTRLDQCTNLVSGANA